MLGVLTQNQLDDGRGSARIHLFRYPHEIQSGRTSSVGMEILGLDEKGEIIRPNLHHTSLQNAANVNHTLGEKQVKAWTQIINKASKFISFSDLAGHERYFKTTTFGITGSDPHYIQLIVGANQGMIGMSKEHLGIALALHLPVYIIVTKIDRAPTNVLENTISTLIKILKSPGCRKLPLLVKSERDVFTSASTFVSER